MNNIEKTAMLLEKIRSMDVGKVNIMEVCGTHTMSIAKSGIKTLLPENIKLLSGPGCPVCVTDDSAIDAILKLAQRPGVMISTYGDMLKVPGSRQGETLAKLKAKGARVEIVYSALDGVELAGQNPGTEVVFIGAGFETTAPGTAMAIKAADEENTDNFSVFSILKTVEPALRALMADPGFNVQGFLCPGHVATIIGEAGFKFLEKEYRIPAVISGFEAGDILVSVYKLLRQMETGRPALENEYKRAVAPEGNPKARAFIDEVFERGDDLWRGLGEIKGSGLKIRKEFERFDAEKKFGIKIIPSQEKKACRCGEVIQGKLSPKQCPMFGNACTPENAAGPCMVSSEGACAAEYKYSYD